MKLWRNATRGSVASAQKSAAPIVLARPSIGEKAQDNYLPIRVPADGDDAGIALCNPTAGVKKGLKFRPLDVTIRDTLEWQKGRPEEKQKLREFVAPDYRIVHPPRPERVIAARVVEISRRVRSACKMP